MCCEAPLRLCVNNSQSHIREKIGRRLFLLEKRFLAFKNAEWLFQ